MHATRPHDERLYSYVEVLNCFLAMYATDGNSAQAIKELELYKEGHGASATLYVRRLNTKALCYGILDEIRHVKPLFVKSFFKSV